MPPIDHSGPWLVVQLLEVGLPERTREKYLPALHEALSAHDLTIADTHPAVDNPDTLLVCCPDLPAAPDELLRNIADLLSRLLSLPSADAVRIAAYPDRAAAHAASGDSAA